MSKKKPSFDADDKRRMEAYQMLLELFKTSHSDNMKVLKALIYARDNQNPLFHGATHRRVFSWIFISLFYHNLAKFLLWYPKGSRVGLLFTSMLKIGIAALD